MATEHASDTTTVTTLDIPQDLATVTDPGTYQLVADLDALADDEVITFRIESRVLTGGTDREMYSATFSAQTLGTAKIVASLAVVSPHSCTFIMEQSNGTKRAIPWAVYAL